MYSPSQRDLISGSGLFDEGWYLDRYEDVRATGMDPIVHYLEIGARLLRDPGPSFSTSGYLAQNPDVAEAGVNPLWHYLAHGKDEGRLTELELPLMKPVDDPAVPRFEGPAPLRRPARVVSFYLPQFHPIPENDEWWGKGFTEWTNVRPAEPQFPGHYQPHVPGDLGYYDLRDRSVQRRQVELAKQYGVEAFCFYFYWFAGKRLLETPLQDYLHDSEADLPFMICWANENWSRRWDGRDDDLLMSQHHSPDDDLAFIEYVAQYLRDPRYERVDGRPVLLVYRPGLLPDPLATAERWRGWCRENGIGEIYLAYTQSFESVDPRTYGFDAAIEFPPNNSGVRLVTGRVPTLPGFAGNIFDWNTLVDRSFTYTGTPFRQFRGICPSWDNTARRGENGTILWGSSPNRFTRWATNAMRDTVSRAQTADDTFVFVNAWNEWAEGAHLEPDERHGYAWLESIRVALACASTPTELSPEPRVAAILDCTHLPFVASVPARLEGLESAEARWVVCRADQEAALRDSLARADVTAEVYVAPGDVGALGLLRLVPVLERDGIELVVRLDLSRSASHASASSTRDAVDRWLARFDSDDLLGLAVLDDDVSPVDELAPWIARLGRRLGLDDFEVAQFAHRPAGSFIARISALAPAASLALRASDSEPSSRGYVPHLGDVVDACLPLSAVAAGTRVAGTSTPLADEGRPSVVVVTHDAHPHGAQHLALSMARTYRALNFDVHIVALGEGPLLERFSEVGRVHLLDPARTSSTRLLSVLGSFRERGARLAIANTTVSGILVPWLKQAGFTVVALVHEMAGVLESMGLRERAELVESYADVTVFPSRTVREQFERFLGRPVARAEVRPQGLYLSQPGEDASARPTVDVRRLHDLAPDAALLLGVGYADHRKGIDLFAQVCADVLREDENATAVWIGHLGPAELIAEAEDILTSAGVRDRFVFAGRVDNPADYYRAADLLLLTSREDPFPSVVLEALDLEVPVVAFRGTTGCEELFERGTAVLVPAFDTSAMASEVGQLLHDPARRASLGQTGRTIVRAEFDFRRYLFDLASFGGEAHRTVSVVVPNYNYAHLLESRLRSITTQTHPIFELIVLDDGSSDESLEVVRAFAAKSTIPVRLVAQEDNSGSVFRQWLKGVRMATGDLVWIAEADDLADPGFLREVTGAFSDPKVLLSYCQSRQIGGDGRVLRRDYLEYQSSVDPEKWTRAHVSEGIDEIRSALFLKNTVPNVSSVVFRREALLATLEGHEDEICSFRNAGDWLTYLYLLRRGRIAFSPEVLSSHRRHEGSVTLSSFDVDQLRQIATIQCWALRRFSLGSDHARRASAYVQKLYEQFGLADVDAPRFDMHPDLTDLATGYVRPEAPAPLSVEGEPRIGVIGIERSIDDLAERAFLEVYDAVILNTGNYMYTEAMYRQLVGDVRHVGFEFDPDVVNKDFDAVVLPATNWLNDKDDWTDLVERLVALDIPAITIGIGVQAHTTDLSRVEVSGSALDLAHTLAAKAPAIGARGDFTAAWLRSIGVENVVTTGCPSLYMKQHGSDGGRRDGLALQSTRFPLEQSFLAEGGPNRRLFQLAGQHDLDIIYQSEMEEMELLLKGADAEIIRHRPAGSLARLYGLDDDEEALDYVRSNGRVFFDLDAWSRYVASKTGVLGTRLHGTIIALNSGTPAVLVPHDSRTAELAEFARIPTLAPEDGFEGWTPEMLDEAVRSADVAGYLETRRRHAAAYRVFLESNGLTPRLAGFTDVD